MRGGVLDLDRSFGFLVNDVARLFGRRFSHNGRWLGLTRAQCRILARIARSEGINQAGLADLLEVRPMTLVRQIDRMEEAGWIERRPDPADRRARLLFLTGKARPILGRIRDVADETRGEAPARLAPAEQAELVGLLTRVHAALSERVPAAAVMTEEADAADEIPVADPGADPGAAPGGDSGGPPKPRRAMIARPRGEPRDEREEILPNVEGGR